MKTKKSAEKGLIVMYLGMEHGFSKQSFATIREWLNRDRKLDWRFDGPHSIYVYLPANQRGRDLVQKMTDGLAELKQTHVHVNALRMGVSAGPVTAEFNWRGRLSKRSLPIGPAVTQAVKNAQ